MPRSPSRLAAILRLYDEVGLSTLAELEARAVLDRDVPERLLTALTRSDRTELTAREREVFVLLASGYSRREVAEHLGIGLETVCSHTKHVYRKLGVHNRVEAINAFIERAA